MKKLVLLAAILAMTLVTVSSALAQVATDQYRDEPGTGEPASATGIVEKPETTAYMYGTHAMTDEASGVHYALESDQVNLDGYVGERITVHGTLVPGYENGQVEGGPPLVNVSRVESSQPSGGTIRGCITSIDGDSVLVEEDPNDRSGSAKGYFTLTAETEILRRQRDAAVPANRSKLRVGQLVEATYAGPAAESYPTQGIAGRILILEESTGNPPGNNGDDSGSGSDVDILPNTGGSIFPVLGIGALLVLCGLLARRIGG